MKAEALNLAERSVAGVRQTTRPKDTVRNENAAPAVSAWNKVTFADEQIRGLVRQVFSGGLNPPVQQVVFTAVERETDVRGLCRWVGRVLAEEKLAEVAVVDESETSSELGSAGRNLDRDSRYRTTPIRQLATRIHKTVWRVAPRSTTATLSDRPSLCSYMAELRREFEYSIVAAPASTMSSKALEMARFADGIILVLSAQHTRRVTALKVRNALGQVRLLGTVLTDREFPIPTNIYRRL
jgi:hypothetical protein